MTLAGFAPSSDPDDTLPGVGSLRLPLSPVADTVLRPWALLAAVVTAVGLVLGFTAGGWTFAAVVAALLVMVGVGWPGLLGSHTPGVAGAMLTVTALLTVLAAARPAQPWPWVAGVLALGVLTTFLRELTRPVPREGLVLSVMAATSGLAVIGAAAMGMLIGPDELSRGALLAAAVAGGASVLGDLVVPAGRLRMFAAVVAAVAGMVGGAVSAHLTGGPSFALALGLGGVAASLAFAVRRIVAQAPAILGWQGQVAAGVASVLFVAPLAWGFLRLV